MRVLFTLLTVAALVTTTANASPYSDFDAGIAARNWDRCQLAITYLSSAIASSNLLANLRPVALTARGSCYARLGASDAALADFDSSLKLEPNDYMTHKLRGQVLWALGHFDGAESEFEALSRIRPDIFDGYDTLATFYARRRNYDGAIFQYYQFVKDFPNYTDGYYGLVGAYEEKRDFASALSYADKLVAMTPKAGAAYRLRADVYERKGDFDESLSDLETALELNPNDQNSGLRRAIVTWRMEKYSNADEKLESFVKSHPNDIYAAIWLSVIRSSAHRADGDLEKRAEILKPSDWPGPIVELFLGKLSPEDVFNTISPLDEWHDGEMCEADFFVAEWQLQHGDKGAAVPLLKKAVDVCRPDLEAGDAASTELKRQQ